MQSETKICQNCKKDFVIEPEDFNFYEKIKVPAPTFCPECRMIRRFIWRNERSFYRRECDLCKKNIITMYSSGAKMVVYCNECWWSDKWDAMEYAQNYNPQLPLLNQFNELHSKVPVPALWSFDSVNCDYANGLGHSKNVYLSSSVIYSEDISYCTGADWSKSCLDSDFIAESEWCYENSHSSRNHNAIFILRCRECIESSFLYDCVNCQNCFMSSNLRNKKYVFRNQQLSEKAYKERMLRINLGSYKVINSLKKEFVELSIGAIHKYADVIKSERVSGDDIRKSKDIKNSFRITDCENVGHSWRMVRSRDVYDVSGALVSEMVYEATIASEHNYLCRFYYQTKESKDIEYASNNINVSHCFACAGLRNKQYCILNKQYTKKEYEELLPKIIENMNSTPYIGFKGRIYKHGEFFPIEFSPFAYNETIAQEYFPLTKEEAIDKGYPWKDVNDRDYKITINFNNLPDDIRNVDEGILKEIIGCEHNGDCADQCTTAFKITPEELQFYKKMNLPLPRLCPNCRHYERIKQRNPLKLWHRKCMKTDCSNEFETSYAPERKEIIYCEQCYNKEVA